MRARSNTGWPDIREYDWKDVASGGAAADLVLAVLANGGRVNLRLISERIYELHPEERNRALAQVALLAGLRRVSETVKMELKRMGLYATIEHNVILRDLYEQAKAEGMEKGVDTATRTALKTILEVKFGRIPDWAASKIDQAPLADLQRWVRQSVTARSLQTLLGRK